MRRLTCEALGTFILVFGGCGAEAIAAKFPSVGVGLLGVALAMGLTVLASMYAFGPISGGHFNPVVSIGLACAGRFSFRDLPAYVAAQLIGAAAGAGLLLALAHGQPSGFHAQALGQSARFDRLRGWSPEASARNGDINFSKYPPEIECPHRCCRLP